MQPAPGDATSIDRLERDADVLDGRDQRAPSAVLDVLDYVYEPVREQLERVRDELKGLAGTQPPYLSAHLHHVLETSGKRIRPALTLLASRFHPCNGRVTEIMAEAVELLHIATLIHDDTVDNSDTRRGKATLSSLWGRNVAVLVGDYVFATSATFVCDTGNIRVIRRFSETIMELSTGELHEIAGAYDWQQTREHYFQRIYNKTASLFTTATEAGAVLSGAPEPICQALKDYGYNLGMAFQIVDDILDFDGTSEEVGKPVGTDLAQGIMTLPSLIAMERHPHDNPIPALFQKPGDEHQLKKAVGLVQSPSIIEESLAVAEDFCNKALRSLAPLARDRSRESLEAIVSYVLRRRS